MTGIEPVSPGSVEAFFPDFEAGTASFSEDLKRDAVRQITERGYPVAEVSRWLGVSQHSLYEWKKKFGASNTKGNNEAEEVRRRKKQLARVTDERDILN